MAWLCNAQAKAEEFVGTNKQFQEATSQVFQGLAVNGRLSALHASKVGTPRSCFVRLHGGICF